MPPEIMQALELIDAYLADEMTYDTLWRKFDAFFMSLDHLEDETFHFLDGVWGDLEVTTSDQNLIEDHPGDYLSEDELIAVLARKARAVRARYTPPSS